MVHCKPDEVYIDFDLSLPKITITRILILIPVNINIIYQNDRRFSFDRYKKMIYIQLYPLLLPNSKQSK